MLGPFPFGPKFQAFETRRCLRELALMIVFFRTATSHLDVELTEGVSGGVLIELHLQRVSHTHFAGMTTAEGRQARAIILRAVAK